MTTAPMTADFAQTVNAVGIGSSAWLAAVKSSENPIKQGQKKVKIILANGIKAKHIVCSSRGEEPDEQNKIK